MTVLWILLAILSVACWVYVGLATCRGGNLWPFWTGFLFPFLWIIGAVITRPNVPPAQCRRQIAQAMS